MLLLLLGADAAFAQSGTRDPIFGLTIHYGEGYAPRHYRLTFPTNVDVGAMTGPGNSTMIYGGKRFFLGGSYIGFGGAISAGPLGLGFYGAVGYEHVFQIPLVLGIEFNAKGISAGQTTAECTIGLGFLL